MSLFLDKSDRFRRRNEFEYLKGTGAKSAGRFFLLISAPAAGENRTLKFGIICSRRFSRLAVRRNRARRLLRESFRVLKPELREEVWILLIPRRAILDAKCGEVTEELRAMCAEDGLLK